MMKCLRWFPFSAAAVIGLSPLGSAQIFQDNFDAGASPLWSNERGNWSAADGTYGAANPTNNPPTRTLLPFVMEDLLFETDVVGVQDGGVWLRYDPATENGVLLVTGGNLQTGRGLYWHIVRNGQYSAITNPSAPIFTPGQTIRVRVVVRGDRYLAFVNDVCTPVTAITNAEFPSGRVGLYDFSPVQSFDNVLLDAAPPPIADFNQDGGVDGADVEAFFVAWEGGDPVADVNQDGGVDGADVETFFAAWSGGCD